MMDPQHAVLERAREELCEYFEGRRTVFSVPMRIAGTAFQERVWREIALIPFGETISYAELARRAGAPEAIRAAGMATGRNRIGVMIPCHRVMGKNGTLTGYAGGVERKRRLLELEGGGENYEV
jgi:methylated-DNA-[protein]-cysteine S-methyltransferase